MADWAAFPISVNGMRAPSWAAAGVPRLPPVYRIAPVGGRSTRPGPDAPRVCAMPRFAWAAWGLLVVVLDLPLLGWDVLPDLVGYVWLFIGLAGGAALHPGFARARAAALVGIPVSVITGTPFTNSSTGVEWGAAFAGILVNVVVLHQLGTAIRDLDPVAGDSDQRRWANGIRIAAPIAGGVQLVGLVLIATVLAILYVLGLLALVVVGIIAVVLLHRVNRAGWLDTLTPATPGEPATP